MKRILITENQYKKLLHLVNEQFTKFNNPEDEKDMSHDIVDTLTYLTVVLKQNKINKDVYVDKIEDGIVYLDPSKYTQEERDIIEKRIETYISYQKNPRDKILPDVFGFDSGVDSDWVGGDIAVVDDNSDVADIDDNSDVADIDDDNDVAVIEDEDEKLYKEVEACNFGKNSKGNKRKVILPPTMDIRFYQDILKKLGTKVTCEKMLFFFAWRDGESSKSTYNPLATTHIDEANEGCYYNCLKNGVGYKPSGCRTCPSGSSPGVRNYKTYNSGLNATYETLTNGRYPNVVRKLKNDKITALEIASEIKELSTWGTGGLVYDIIRYNNTLQVNPIEKYDGGTIIDNNCVLTRAEHKFYNEHIKSKKDGDAFREWVNSDGVRLNYVNRKLSDCSLFTGLDRAGELNNYLEIAFKHKGREWVKLGKPGLVKDEEVIDTGEIVLLPPNKKGWNIRGTDCYGSGSYGASRGIRKHRGIDIKSDEGDSIVSPIDGYISSSGYRIYTTKCSYLIGVDVTGTGKYSGYRVRLFYVKGTVPINTPVKKGDPIGVQQSLQKNCYPKKINDKYCMTNHVHVELYVNGVRVNPTNYNWGKSISKSDEIVVKNEPKKTPSIVGNNEYILGKKIVVDLNGPKNHESRKLGNWQSDNATDIFGTPGTTVYSITKGVVSKIGGNDNDHTGKIYGGSITVKGKDGYSDIFYTHLQKIKVVKGQEVNLGTPLAEISLWETSPSGSHVHVGLPYGVRLNSLIDLSTGKIK